MASSLKSLSFPLVFFLLFACGGKPAPKSVVAPVKDADVEYDLGPDDVLQIDVWKRPELSREVTVRPDGSISLPLVNDVRAAGLSVPTLSGVLKEKFRDFVAEPEVTVVLKVANSFKIYVLGKVVASGAFTLKTPVSVLQAIAMAGGFTPFASPDDVVVLRKEAGKDVRIRVDYDQIVSGKRPEKNITLKPGDTVVVP